LSQIETIYDALVALVAAELPDYMRFPNPYVIDTNTFLHQRSGFGVSIGPGTDTERYLGCLVTWQRDFNVTLVRQITTTPNNTALRSAIEKEILDDHDKLRKAIYLSNTLSGNAIKSTLIADSGLNFIDGDRLKFLALEMTVQIEYEESPS
jgi:hypothetical protein